MRLLFAALALLFLIVPIAPAAAQGCGPQNPNCLVPNRPFHDSTNSAANTRFVQQNSGGLGALVLGTTVVSGGANTQVLFDNNGLLGEYTNTQLTVLINPFTSVLSGAVPASGGGTTTFLRADGAWAIPPGGGGGGGSPGGSNLQVQFNNAGSFGGYTNIQLTALIQAFTSSLSGAVPASGGGTTNFLRADGTWVAPGGSGAPGGVNGQLQYNNAGSFGGFALAGDCTFSQPNITCTKTNGTILTAAATTAIGTSGATIPLLNGNNVYSGTANFTSTFQIGSNTITFGAAGQMTYRIFSGTKALATAAILSGACTASQSDTATGTTTSDAIIVSFASDPTAVLGYQPTTNGMLTIIPYPTTDLVNFKVCNNTSASITPGAISLNWRVVR